MKPKTSKRIVSRREYTALLAKKIMVSTLGLSGIWAGLLLFAAMCLLLKRHSRIDMRVANLAIAFCLFSSLAAYVGAKLLHSAEKIDPGTPLTRANTADLPAPDSLVRASEEPLQTQEAVLLRAAAEGQEKHEEQLVRASMGRE